MYWLLLGNTIYLVSGIVLAIVLNDDRAFRRRLATYRFQLMIDRMG